MMTGDALTRMAEAGRAGCWKQYTVERLAQDFKRIYALTFHRRLSWCA